MRRFLMGFMWFWVLWFGMLMLVAVIITMSSGTANQAGALGRQYGVLLVLVSLGGAIIGTLGGWLPGTRKRSLTARGADPQRSETDEVERLAALRQKNLISEEEFQAAKKKLLSTMGQGPMSKAAKARQEWRKTREMGRFRFVLVKWVLVWGLTTAVLYSMVMAGMNGTSFAHEFRLAVFTFPIGGIVAGLWMWHYMEKRYLTEKRQASSDEPKAAPTKPRKVALPQRPPA